ncbi:MAG: haloacid dehalogenase type II [Chthoniobacterales bacterium]
MKRRPKAVALDVIGTLFRIQPLDGKLQKIGLAPSSLEIWLPRVLRDAFGLESAGAFESFPTIASGTLAGLMSERGLEPDDSAIAQVIESIAELPAFPDVEPGLRAIRSAELRVAVLTNGTQSTTKKMLQHAGLGDLIDEVISVDDVRHWKPNSAVYLHAAGVLKVAPDELALIAAHDWDIDGASRAGLTTGYIARKQPRCSSAMRQPDVSGADLTEVVEQLLALPV